MDCPFEVLLSRILNLLQSHLHMTNLPNQLAMLCIILVIFIDLNLDFHEIDKKQIKEYQSIIHSFKKCSVGYGIERSFSDQSIKERVKYFVLLFRNQGHFSRAFSKGLNYKVIRLRICKGLICMNVLFLFQIDFMFYIGIYDGV